MTPDYQAALSGAALFDRSAVGKLVLTGPDAAMFLGNLCTNDVRSLPAEAGCEAYFCSPTAKVQFQAWVYRDGDDYWVETTPGRNEDLYKYLDRYLISERVEIADRTAEHAQFHLAGPTAGALLANVSGGTTAGLPEFGYVSAAFGADFGAGVSRRDLLGVAGYDVVCPAGRGIEMSRLLIDFGAVAGAPETYETLRIEAGTPVFGPDIDANRFVMEVGNAARAVSYSKGCYLGQEPIVMARDRAGHVNRLFTGLKVLDGGPPPAGAKLLRDGTEVGVVTSSCHSPRLGVPVALGYVRWKHHEPGTRLEIVSDAGRIFAEVVGLPPVK